MFRSSITRGSLRSQAGHRRSRPLLQLERCEDRLAAGQLFSLLASPLDDLFSPSLQLAAPDGEVAASSTFRFLDNLIAPSVTVTLSRTAHEPSPTATMSLLTEEDHGLTALAAADLLDAAVTSLDVDFLQPPFAALENQPAPKPAARARTEQTTIDPGTAAPGGGNLILAASDVSSLGAPTSTVMPLAQRDAVALTQLAGAAVDEPLPEPMDAPRPVALQGTLEVLCAHEENGPGWKEYYLNAGSSRVQLQAADSLADTPSGTVLTVRGVLGSSGLTVAPEGITIHSTPEDNENGGGSVQATRTVLVLNVNFSDRVSQPWTLTTARNLFNTNIANWFSQGSYGQTTLAADVLGWYTLATTSTACNTGTWSSMAQTRARQAGYEPNNYNHVVIAFPRVPACSWAGLGQVPGRITWLNNAMSLSVAVHELGHNLGLRHSKSQRCTTSPLTGSCTTTEYGDRYDVMGSGGQAHFHAGYRASVGWIPSGSRRTVTPSVGAAYVGLSPASSATGTRLLRVQRRGRSDYLHVEVRTATGYDSVLNQYGNLMNGVAVYLGTSLSDHKVVDFTYTTSSAGDAAIRFGNTLYDTVGDVAIVSLYRVSGISWVYVQYGI